MNTKAIHVVVQYGLSDEHIAGLRAISDRLQISHYPDTPLGDIPAETREAAEVLLTAKSVPKPEEMPTCAGRSSPTRALIS